MKLIIKDANLSVNADLSIIKDVSIDEFYALLSEEQKKEIKIDDEDATNFHDKYEYEIDKVVEGQDLSSLSFDDIIKIFEKSDLSIIDELKKDYIEKANTYSTVKEDEEEHSSQVSEISGDESPPSKDLLDVLREVTMSEGQFHFLKKGIAILKEDSNSYRRVEINDIEKITGDHKYTQEELNNKSSNYFI